MRWEAVALAFSILAALGMWTLLLRRSGDRSDADLGYVILGIIPGAVVGGRLFHGLAYLDAYLADPGALFDLSQGSLSLVGAVLGGLASGAYVCALLGRPASRWSEDAALPLLVLIGLGKLSMFLAGGGQGVPFDGDWAVAFDGPGPWLSADPSVPAHPAQVYEGLWVLVGVVVGGWAMRRGHVLRAGRHLASVLCWWLAGRVVISMTWRDDRVVGPMGAEAALDAIVLALVVLVVLGAHVASRARRRLTR